MPPASAPPQGSKRHQQRALALMRAVHPSRIETEVAVPESSRWIDALLHVERPNPCWGVIGPDLAARQVLLEHYSAPPQRSRLTSTMIKAAWALDRWAVRSSARRRPPLTLIVSVGRPARGLRLLGFEDDPVGGLYRARLGALELLLADVRGLPDLPGTRFLRTFDHRPEVAAANLRRLYEDPTLSRGVKLAIGEAVMKQPALWDPREHQLTAKELLALGEERAVRRLVEVVLRARLGSLSRQLSRALAECSDRSRLERVHQLAVDEADAGKLRRRALEVLTAPSEERPKRRRKRRST